MKNRLKILRKQKKLTGSQLAEMVGTSQATIARIESGKRRLSDYWMEKIAQALEIMPIELFSDGRASVVDEDLLVFIITEVEEWLTENSKKLDPENKAKVITYFYEKSIEAYLKAENDEKNSEISKELQYSYLSNGIKVALGMEINK